MPLALVASSLLLVGCPKSTPSPVVDAGPAAPGSAKPTAAAPPSDAGAAVDLLWATHAIVAVSSRVDNPRDLPDHLVDHKAETAWNGKTGDLVGAWVAFRVPKDAHVDHVMLSAGYDKKGPKEDLFLGNHRVTKVRVLRDGKALKEATLSPDERLPQKIAIDADGGDFRLEVLAVTPGTHASWKEIALSELGVFGKPGAHLNTKPGPPIVRIGSLDLRELPYEGTEGASYEAACREWSKWSNDAADESRKDLGRDKAEKATCDLEAASKKPGKQNVVETAHVAVNEPPQGMYDTHFDGSLLALRSKKGVTLTNVRVSGTESAWFWRVEYKLVAEKWDGDRLVVDVDELRVTDSDGYAPPGHEDELHSEVTTKQRTVCDAEAVTCHTTERP